MGDRDVRVVREGQLAAERPGGVADLALEAGAARGALDDLDEDDRRDGAEGARPAQPHPEGPEGGRDLAEVGADGREPVRLHLGGRNEGDVRGDAVRSGVPEARAQLLELAAVRLRDRDRNAERYGPHVSLLRLSMWTAAAPVWRQHPLSCQSPLSVVAFVSAWRAPDRAGRTPARASRRRRHGPSPRPWPGWSPASRGRPGTPGCAA